MFTRNGATSPPLGFKSIVTKGVFAEIKLQMLAADGIVMVAE